MLLIENVSLYSLFTKIIELYASVYLCSQKLFKKVLGSLAAYLQKTISTWIFLFICKPLHLN